MNKTMRFCSFIFIMLGIFLLASCGTGKSGIKGQLTYEAKRNELEVTAEFEKNSKLEESGTSVSIKLYTEEESFKTSKTASVQDGIQAQVSFTNLEQNTKYILKLFVSVDGYEEELDRIEASTKNEGDSEETAIEINTVEEFLNIKNDTSAYYKLNADLDLTDEGTVSLFTSSSKFTGTFDGGNHTIKNYKLTSTEYAGLFGYISEAVIKNLVLENVSIEMTNSTKNFGAVAGRADQSTIENVRVNGCTVTNSSYSTSDVFIGGFIGRSDGSVMTDCSIENVSLTLTAVKPSSSNLSYIGLFAGHILGVSELTSCSAGGQATVGLTGTGMISVGGFAGVNDSARLLKSCYTVGTLAVTKTGASNSKELTVGGFIGKNITGQCNLEDCLAVADITVLSNAEEDTARTTALATAAYIGGFIGRVEISPLGIAKCYYASKETGLKIICKAAEEENADSFKASLTIAKASANATPKITEVYAYDAVSAIEGMELDTSDVSAEHITVLSEALQNILKNRA